MKDLMDMTPPRSSGSQMILKTLMGAIIGLALSFLIFIILKFIGDAFITQTNSTQVITNPLFPLVLLIISFVVIFVGNGIKASLSNVFRPERYYDMWAILRAVFLTNMLLFVFAAPLYLIFAWEVDILFWVLAYHIIFATFVTNIQIETISNPHYSLSHVLWATLWFALAMVIMALVVKTTYLSDFQDKLSAYLLFPPVLWFACIPFAQTIWEMIYRRWYEWWSDFFFTPSPSDTLTDTEDGEWDFVIEEF